MENATDALKIAFAVIAFTLALAVSMFMFSKLNSTSTFIISSTDSTQYYEYEGADINKTSRIVGIETIIPTLYKYYKENYTVIFLNEAGNPLGLYKSVSKPDLWGQINATTDEEKGVGNIGKYYTANKSQYSYYDQTAKVCSFDVDEEGSNGRHEPWTGTTEDYKKNLDAFFNGGIFYYPSYDEAELEIAYDYSKQFTKPGGFIGNYGQCKFKEMIGEYTYNIGDDSSQNELLKNRKKRVIIYQLQ